MRDSLSALIVVAALALAPRGARAAQDDPVADELKRKAQQAYLQARYADAVAANLELAEKHPDASARRYAVQMLGTLYEENVVDLGQAIAWNREFLRKYADPRQAPFYEKKLSSLEQLARQKDAFAEYQRIRFANLGDDARVKRLERLLADHPGFELKDDVQRELGQAYARLDQRERSHRAFEALAAGSAKPLAPTDRVALETTGRHWRETAIWARIAWGVVVLLWGAALLLNPWKQIGRASIRTFLILAFAWVAVTALRMPTFYSLETLGYPIIIPDRVVYAAAGLNLTVLLWVTLFSAGRFWQTRRVALRLVSPVLTVAMTISVLYLLVIHQPNGPQVLDAFSAQYERWGEEWSRHEPRAELEPARPAPDASGATAEPRTWARSRER